MVPFLLSIVTGAVLAALLLAPAADACGRLGDSGPIQQPVVRDNGDGTETHTYFCGPITVTGGQNRILYPQMRSFEKPSEDGWITSLEPDMVALDGNGKLYVPTSDKVMFHHGVWINQNRPDATSSPGRERFYATGEEKTELRLPDGYGYRYLASDTWMLNHMIHNLVPEEFTMYIKWTIDFVPDESPAAEDMKRVRPIWMDIDNGSYYPVFDVWRGEGGSDGVFTFPDDTYRTSNWPYSAGRELNRWTVDRSGYLVSSVGHVHSGGLWTDLNLIRKDASYAGPDCSAARASADKADGKLKAANRRLKAARKKAKKIPASRKARKAAARRAVIRAGKKRGRLLARKTVTDDRRDTCLESQPRVSDDYLTGRKKALVFRSDAKYFDRIPGPKRSGPVSWDMGMYNASPDFRAQLEPGDILETNTAYETRVGSWFESMGIHISYMADGQGGENPFKTRLDNMRELNHGPKPENEVHGGDLVPGAPDPTKMADGLRPSGELLIGGYTFGGGAFFPAGDKAGQLGRPLVVKRGESLRFQLSKTDWDDEVWHSLTACKAPCNRSTGIAYPLPDGEAMFDSGQMGRRYAGSGANNQDYWDTPKSLPVGTHTFYCRIHPLMRGAIRVVPNG